MPANRIARALSAAVEALEPRTLCSTAALPRPDHVVIVVEENHSYSNIIGSRSARYINTLARNGAVFTDSHGIAHPSQPNYLALFSGSAQGVTGDECPVGPFSVPNLGGELEAAGLSFGGYSEGLPRTGSLVCKNGSYSRKHNPWSDFSDVPASDNLRLGSFPRQFDALPTVSFVIPNRKDNMHSGSVKAGDRWLQSHLGKYATWAQSHNSLLIVTWDEDDGSVANHIPTLFSGPMIMPGQYGESINHYNVLRTIEDIYGLAPAGSSADAAPITDVFNTGSAALQSLAAVSAGNTARRERIAPASAFASLRALPHQHRAIP